MTSQARIEANRKNATKSTGPKTPEGKAASRGNAIRHGMAGQGVVTIEAIDEAFRDRREAWGRSYPAETDEARWTLDRLVAASIRIERCQKAFDRVIVDQAERARSTWDRDRAIEAANLWESLRTAPTEAAMRLESTLQGAKLKRDLWRRLAFVLDEGGAWDDDQDALALDLLGIPHALRTGRTTLDGPTEADPRDHRLLVAEEEMERLDEVIEDLVPLDAVARSEALAGDSAFFSENGRLVLRYEREATRAYQRARRTLLEPDPVPPPPAVPPPATASTDSPASPSPPREPDPALRPPAESTAGDAPIARPAPTVVRARQALSLDETNPTPIRDEPSRDRPDQRWPAR